MYRRASGRKGQVYAVVAVSLVVLLAMAALTMDVGVMAVSKQQLQAAADAGALAGVAMLQRTFDVDLATQAAIEAAGANAVLGNDVDVDAETDVVIGAWTEDGEIVPFDESGGVISVPDGPVAVQVTVRRTEDSPDGPISLQFARIFGIDHIELSASATAGLTISHQPRTPVEVVIVQDQSGSFEDEFPYAREGDVQLIDFLKNCYLDGDRAGIVGFGYHPYHAYSTHPSRRDTWYFHDYALSSTEDSEDGAQATMDYISNMETVPYYRWPQRYCGTNLYTGLLLATLSFASPQAKQDTWDAFVDSLYYNGSFRDIGWWRRYYYSTLKQKMAPIFQQGFANPNARHVVVLVSDGMPWYHGNSFPDWRSKELCQYIADQMAEIGIKIHTVTLCQNDEPPDGNKGADGEYNASLVRNDGFAFYTYDAERLSNLLVGVGQVEVGQARLIR